MKLFKKTFIFCSLFGLIAFTSCKNNENKDNDVMNDQPGSFDDNHTEETDTVVSPVDSTTSNSTQTDPTAS